MNFGPTGVDDDALLAIKVQNEFPTTLTQQINELLEELEQYNNEKHPNQQFTTRSIILRSLINLTLQHEPLNLLQYLWYVRFATTILLLRKIPNSLLDARITVVSNAFGSVTTDWAYNDKLVCVIKCQHNLFHIKITVRVRVFDLQIHLTAEAIYRISSDPANIADVVTNISSYSDFSRLVSNALVWAGFRTLENGKAVRTFHMSEVLSRIYTFA